MFRFKILIDNFVPSMSGPSTDANMRAKWLPRFCPSDLMVAFAPNPGQVPIYPSTVQIVEKQAPGWWNHFVQNYTPDFQLSQGTRWSTGPNFDQNLPLRGYVPMVVCSEYHRQIVIKQHGYPAHLIHVIPGMVDSELFYPRTKANEIVVGWIGHDLNGLLKGPEVMPFLARKFPAIRFEMVLSNASSNQHGWLNDHPPNLTIKTGVPHPHMAEIISKWHIMVCGSKDENCPNQILEAMTCGVPVIASAVGGIYEIASSQRLLYDVNWGSPPYWWLPDALDKYAVALQELLTNEAYRQTLSKLALKASKRFTPEAISKKWFEFMYFCRDFEREGHHS
ncbi:glycosyltransferase involved in cell wall biosynthesis [Paenibacillus taihuensis]|uniref:Glycosyltransferase involved in cell wall biosynthesis n=1 Tax=Paenibacillus taihuensis TaxID=1156355 RepID=A0A3D9SJV1_9BACL|nr:glycosyltransferase family 4 protein [Paenibacillus taihuensis]REE93153.1 glycosyltransferase involved in cell wall biosynthesis [Paenibacillus taihuensis]